MLPTLRDVLPSQVSDGVLTSIRLEALRGMFGV